MHDWLPNKIVNGTLSLNLTEIRYLMKKEEIDLFHKNSIVFVNDKWDTQKIIIDHRYFSQKTMSAFEKLKCIIEMSISNAEYFYLYKS